MLEFKTFTDTIKDNLSKFVGEQNNVPTRERIYNILKTLLEYNKSIGDVYDYLIVRVDKSDTEEMSFTIQIYIKRNILDEFNCIVVIITESEINILF